jgi:uncharacterized membrane protein
MNVAAPVTSRRPAHLPLIAILLVLAASLLWFLRTKLHYANYALASYTDYFWPRRAGLVPHILAGIVASTAGLVQIWLGLTNRTGALHHALGKVYVTGVLVGSIAGLYLALTIPAGHLAYTAGLFMLSVAWMITTAMALYAIRNRQMQAHRDWMLRSYIVTFAFVTFRLLAKVLRNWISVPEDPVADQIDITLAWACWSVPLLIAAALIQWRAIRSPYQGP